MLAIHGCGGHQFALEAHRRSVTEGRMSAASIVPTFDPFKDRQLRLDLRAKVAPIEQLTLQRGEKRSPTEPTDGMTPISRQRLPKAKLVYWQP